MADVHKSSFDDAELPENESFGEDAPDDLESNLEDDPGTGRGPSLDELTDIYAALIQRDDDANVASVDEPEADPDNLEEEEFEEEEVDEEEFDEEEFEEEEFEEEEFQEEEPLPPVEVTPLSILESMLFVGNPENEPLKSKQVAALLRGVSPREIDELVKQLNERYADRGCPYQVDSVGGGYLMRLRPEFSQFRDKFYGRIREARLSQQAIDVLAIVAYRPGATRVEIDDLRGRNSGSILSQLVRRRLLRVERTGEKPRKPSYFPTDRFLGLFGLENLDELPQSQELEYED